MGVWGVVIFVLSVMRVVGGVPLWVECVFCRVYGVCFVSVVHPVAILSAVFCVICSLCLMLVVTIFIVHLGSLPSMCPRRHQSMSKLSVHQIYHQLGACEMFWALKCRTVSEK